jgi:hypothetical protein
MDATPIINNDFVIDKEEPSVTLNLSGSLSPLCKRPDEIPIRAKDIINPVPLITQIKDSII